MGKKTLSAIITSIFITAFIAGIFSGASIKSGEDIDPDSLMVKALGIVCDSIKDVEAAYNTCRSSFIFLTLAVFVIGFIEIFATASEIGNIWVGLSIYGVGWLVGLILILAN